VQPVTLSWTCSDPDGNPLVYDIFLGQPGGNLNEVASDIAETQYELPMLDHETEYEWKVTAQDTEGHRFHGPIWSFTTDMDPNTYPGVYAELVIHRSRRVDESTVVKNDHISARFDSSYAPDGPIDPLQPASVFCQVPGAGGGYSLEWVDAWKWYYYYNPYAGYFLGPGAEYVFNISGGGVVPDLLTGPIVFPECAQHIISPAAWSSVTALEGLEIVWAGYDSAPDCDQTVVIRIEDLSYGEWTDVYIETENDGSYTFTADDVSGIDPMAYQLQIVLILEHKRNLTFIEGYDPRSWISARVQAVVPVMIQY
jgi:hypothetical protein